MSTHISAKQGEIAEKILLPGDPYRAKYIAENFLQNAVRYSEVRGMYGYTGTYNGQRVSVQGTGMGIPSISIYATELIAEYGCKQLVRIGTCGAFSADIHLLDILLAQAASTTSAATNSVFGQNHFAPIADFSLLNKAYTLAGAHNINVRVGGVLTDDNFYHDEFDVMMPRWQAYGVLAVEMETAGLYSIAARHKVQALSILTVSDHLVTGEQTSSETREKALNDMIVLGLETLVK